MPKVTLRPSGHEIEVSSDKNLLESLRDEGIFLNSSCGGFASCSDCRVIVKSGQDVMGTQSFEETQLMGNVFHVTKERLACQLFPQGDMVLDTSLHKNLDIKPVKPKTAPTRVRKKEEVEDIHKERREKREAKEAAQNGGQETEPWFKHWEKTEDAEGTPVKKRLGGGDRPKFFRTDNFETLEIDKVSEEDVEKKPDKKES